MKLKEMKQKMFAKPNCGPKLVIVDYSKVIIKAVLHEFLFGQGMQEILKQMTLVERLFMFLHVISYKWVDEKSRKF